MRSKLPSARHQVSRRPLGYRLCLEQLEERLPPGALLGAAVWPWVWASPFWPGRADDSVTVALAGEAAPAGAQEQAGSPFIIHDVSSPLRAHAGVVSPVESDHPALTREANSSDLVEIPSPLGWNDSDSFLSDRAPSPFPRQTSYNPVTRGSGQIMEEALLAAHVDSASPHSAEAAHKGESLLAASRESGSSKAQGVGHPTRPATAPTAQLLSDFGRLPLSFVANQGQADPRVQFTSVGSAYTLFLTAEGAVLSLQKPPGPDGTIPAEVTSAAIVQMQVVGANAATQAVGRDLLPGRSNYFVGKDPSQWRTGAPTFARVEYANIYPGIDLVYYGDQGHLEYDFVVAPGADPGVIGLAFTGADQMEIDTQAQLVLHTAGGSLTQHQPVLYQKVDGVRREVAGGYVRKGPQQVGFQVGPYNPGVPLVIDPVLSYSTYLGGIGREDAFGMAADGDGNVYLTGETTSPDFPTTDGAFQRDYRALTSNAFVAKLDPTGTSLVYSTFLGGEGRDRGNGIAIDAAGNAYVAGRTNSTAFPTTLGAYQTRYHEGGEYDAFVTKLSPAGDQLCYSTYLGGSANDAAFGIAVDVKGDAFVTGGTNSDDFPVTPLSAYQYTNLGTDAFMSELNPTGSDLVYSTYLGGSLSEERANAIAVDGNGYVYITGQTPSPDFPTKNAFQPALGGDPYVNDAFVAKFDPTASGDSSLVYSTFLGGREDDRGLAIAVDSNGDAVVAGETYSTDFPTMNPWQPDHRGDQSNVFVAEVNPTGDGLLFSTYLGGNGNNIASAVALDPMNNIYLTGFTTAADFPTANPIQASLNGPSDAFVVAMDATGRSLVFSTYLGGSGNENLDDGRTHSGGIGVDAAGNIYVVGKTESTDFPTMDALQPHLAGEVNAFVVKISPTSNSPAFSRKQKPG